MKNIMNGGMINALLLSILIVFLSQDLRTFFNIFSRIPGIGARSAQRAVLYLLKNQERVLPLLEEVLSNLRHSHHPCSICGYIDNRDPCFFCTSDQRDGALICIVADSGDVWTLEKGAFFKGKYHVLGGLVSSFHGQRPDALNIERLKDRLDGSVKEVIIALDGTMEGQTTLHYLTEKLNAWNSHVRLSTLARGLPVGGSLGYADQGTLTSAFAGRQHLVNVDKNTASWHNDANVFIESNAKNLLFGGGQ